MPFGVPVEPDEYSQKPRGPGLRPAAFGCHPVFQAAGAGGMGVGEHPTRLRILQHALSLFQGDGGGQGRDGGPGPQGAKKDAEEPMGFRV